MIMSPHMTYIRVWYPTVNNPTLVLTADRHGGYSDYELFDYVDGVWILRLRVLDSGERIDLR
jgi:hypothetical protein